MIVDIGVDLAIVCSRDRRHLEARIPNRESLVILWNPPFNGSGMPIDSWRIADRYH